MQATETAAWQTSTNRPRRIDTGDVSVHPSAAGAASIWFDPPAQTTPTPVALEQPIRPVSSVSRPGATDQERDRSPDPTGSVNHRLAEAVKPLAGDSLVEPPTLQPESAEAASWTPAWEVDSFDFPELISRVIEDSRLLRAAGHPLELALSQGVKTLLVTADRPRVGRTSVAVCLAVAAARAGLRVAIVDATAASGSKSTTLTEALKLDVNRGWLEAIRDSVPVSETAIRSIEDQLTLLPWVGPVTDATVEVDELVTLLAAVKSAFDLVVVDGPTVTDPSWETFTATARQRRSTMGPTSPRSITRELAPLLEAAVVVRDARDTSRLRDVELVESLERRGLIALGLVENFV